jgi:hypothetical protein
LIRPAILAALARPGAAAAADAAAADNASFETDPSSHPRRASMACLGRCSSGAKAYHAGRACSAHQHAKSHSSRSVSAPG